jgi:hypothetical protein
MHLGIDPGITTGVALVSSSGEVLKTFCVDKWGVLTLSPEMEMFLGVLTVTIEDTPVPTRSRMNQMLSAIVTHLRYTFPGALWVPPGVWKNSPVVHIPVKAPTPHERDAVRLVLWRLSRERLSQA